MKKIVVAGSTGNLGSAVVNELKKYDYRIIAGTTNPSEKSSVCGVETVRFQYEDKESMENALSGAYGLFLIAPPMDPESDKKLIPAIDVAKKAGVSHIIFNSALGVDMAEDSPLYGIEKYLEKSGIDYTILRPNFFMENFSSGFIAPMIAQGGIYLAAEKGKTSFISTEDIASVAAFSFNNKEFGRVFNITGVDSIDHNEAAEIISRVSGKRISYCSITEEDMCNTVREEGMPEGSIQMMAGLYHAVREGFMSLVTDDVKKITGRAPLRFEEFVEKNKALFV